MASQRPTGALDVHAAGFYSDGISTREVCGRPVGSMKTAGAAIPRWRWLLSLPRVTFEPIHISVQLIIGSPSKNVEFFSVFP